MSIYRNITILGDGGWGTTLAILLSENKDLKVNLWSPFEAYAKSLDKKRLNPNYLKGIRIPKSIFISHEQRIICGSNLIVVAVPSVYLRETLQKFNSFYDNSTPVLSVVKGIENKSLLRMSEVISEIWKPKYLSVLSGPTIAIEVAKKIPTTAVVSSKSQSLMKSLQHIFMRSYFRVYTNSDIVGVEFGGSLKNVIAIACGISDGLGFGTNTKAAILSRGLNEISRLGVALGAKRDTFSGISGLGDLVTTCFNTLSRNHFVGERVGRGESIEAILGSMKMVAEGVPTAKSAHYLGKKMKIELPIINEIYNVLFKNRSPQKAVRNLMLREKRSE